MAAEHTSETSLEHFERSAPKMIIPNIEAAFVLINNKLYKHHES